jgi:hypothetical protein
LFYLLIGMSLKAEILALQERITWFDNMIRACQQSTGWEEAIKNAISRRDRWLIQTHQQQWYQNIPTNRGIKHTNKQWYQTHQQTKVQHTA